METKRLRINEFEAEHGDKGFWLRRGDETIWILWREFRDLQELLERVSYIAK